MRRRLHAAVPLLGLLALPVAAGMAGLLPALPGGLLGPVFYPPVVTLPEGFPPAAGEAPPGLLAVLTDGAGLEARDTASGGPSPGAFLHLESSAVCGSPCRINAGDDELWGLLPGSSQPDWPFHWSSGIATVGRPGGTYSQATVFFDTNGYVAFRDPTTSTYTPTPLPEADDPDALVAADWQDLDPSATGPGSGVYAGISGSSPTRVLYLEWWNVPRFASTCNQQVEVALFEADNHVEVYYLTNCPLSSAVGGEENSAGTAGLTWFDGAPPSETAVRYRDALAPAPQISISCGTLGPNGWCISPSNHVTITDNDDFGTSARGLGVKTRTYTLDGGASQSYSPGASVLTTLADGAHPLAAQATDWAGNAGSASADLRVDTVPPTADALATCSLAGLGGWCRGSVTVSGTAQDATSGLADTTCSLDGAPQSCASASVSDDGEHEFTTAATDAAGWTASDTAPFRIDVELPRVSVGLDCPTPAGEDCDGPVMVTTTATDAVSGLGAQACTLDGAAVACGAFEVAAAGTHVVEVRATDVAGNEAAANATFRVLGPLARIVVTGPARLYALETATFQAQGFDDLGSPVPLQEPTFAWTAPATSGLAQACTTERGKTGCADVDVFAKKAPAEPFVVYTEGSGTMALGLPVGGLGHVDPLGVVNFRRFSFAADDCRRDLRLQLTYDPPSAEADVELARVALLYIFEVRLRDALTGDPLPNGTFTLLRPGTLSYALDGPRALDADVFLRRGANVSYFFRAAGWQATDAECRWQGRVAVNEFEPNPAGTDVGTEWVEIKNEDFQEVDLGGWTLRAEHGVPRSHTFPAGTLVPAGGFLVVTFASQFLDNTEEVLVLAAPRDWEVDRTPARTDGANDGRSWQRTLDLAEAWSFAAATPAAGNG